MADPMKIRAQMKGDVAEIRVLMSHPMETGQRKDNAGKPIPAHFIQSLIVAVKQDRRRRVIEHPCAILFGFKVSAKAK